MKQNVKLLGKYICLEFNFFFISIKHASMYNKIYMCIKIIIYQRNYYVYPHVPANIAKTFFKHSREQELE